MTTTVGVSVAILGTLGLVFGGLIAFASRKLWVWEDPRIEVVAGLLPGNNCGACGQAGCRSFAEAVIAGSIQPAQCSVMDAAGAASVASYLGIDAGVANRKVARLQCGGGDGVALRRAEYRGLQTCAAAAAVAGGASRARGPAWGLRTASAPARFAQSR